MRRYRTQFDLDENYIYGIFSSDKSKLIGIIASKKTIAEGSRKIGYWLHKDCINNGYTTEASSALIKVAFEADKMERVEIRSFI